MHINRTNYFNRYTISFDVRAACGFGHCHCFLCFHHVFTKTCSGVHRIFDILQVYQGQVLWTSARLPKQKVMEIC